MPIVPKRELSYGEIQDNKRRQAYEASLGPKKRKEFKPNLMCYDRPEFNFGSGMNRKIYF
jgi:hypothetical protein